MKGEPDDDGFYLGEVDGMQGLVPSNYLQEVEEFPEDAGPHHSGAGNRNVIRPIAQRDRNRGHGPGARGPPPPPRDGMPPRGDPRDRRKGMYEEHFPTTLFIRIQCIFPIFIRSDYFALTMYRFWFKFE